jgi:hypothetical protein
MMKLQLEAGSMKADVVVYVKMLEKADYNELY